MKETLVALLSVASFIANGQIEVKPAQGTDLRFTCQELRTDTDTRKFFLKENVKIESPDIYLEADSAEYDPETKSIVAYATRSCTFRGGEAVIKKDHGNTIRYTTREKVIYIE